MTIKIITGTITGLDVFGELRKLKKRGFFYQWYLTKHGWGKKKTKIVSGLQNLLNPGMSGFRLIQTTGSGKTLLAAIWLYQAHKKGFSCAANMNLSFVKKVDTYNEFLALTNTKILLDDIRHVISSWQSKDAKISSEMANSSRKKGNEIFITTQRLENFVPPDIRNITDELHVPYIRCFDATRKSPDGRYYPLELNDLRFSAGMEFLDYKTYDLTGKAGQLIMNSFDTMQISDGLK